MWDGYKGRVIGEGLDERLASFGETCVRVRSRNLGREELEGRGNFTAGDGTEGVGGE